MNDKPESLATLRIEIDARWVVSEYVELLKIVNELHGWWAAMDRERRWRMGVFKYYELRGDFDPLERFLERQNQYVTLHELVLAKHSYGSRGITDVTGLAGAIGKIADFILGIIKLYTDRRRRELAENAEELEQAQGHLELIADFLVVAKSMGFTKAQTRLLMASLDGRVEFLGRLVCDGKLIDAALLGKKKEEHDTGESEEDPPQEESDEEENGDGDDRRPEE